MGLGITLEKKKKEKRGLEQWTTSVLYRCDYQPHHNIMSVLVQVQ